MSGMPDQLETGNKSDQSTEMTLKTIQKKAHNKSNLSSFLELNAFNKEKRPKSQETQTEEEEAPEVYRIVEQETQRMTVMKRWKVTQVRRMRIPLLKMMKKRKKSQTLRSKMQIGMKSVTSARKVAMCYAVKPAQECATTSAQDLRVNLGATGTAINACRKPFQTYAEDREGEDDFNELNYFV